MSSFLSKSHIAKIYEVMEHGFWSAHETSIETYSHFEQKVFWFRILIVCFYVDMCISCTLCYICSWYPKWYFLANSSRLEYMLFILFFIMASIGADIMCYLHVYIAIYVALNIYIQMMILAAYFQSITEDLQIIHSITKDELEIVQENQIKAKDRLVFGIKQHIAMKRYPCV